MQEMKIIDPEKIPSSDLPLIVLSAHDTDSTSWLIRWFTNSSYNHIMWMNRKGFLASQGLLFGEVPIEKYMKKGCRLKFWAIKDFTATKKRLACSLIKQRLDLPWYKRRYDFLGIIGQSINIRWINNPWTTYCSEQMASDLLKIVSHIPGKPSPEELNKLFKTRPDEFEYCGHWFFD